MLADSDELPASRDIEWYGKMIDISGIGALTVFAAGLVSFLSPCVLPLVPAYVSYVAGESVQSLEARKFIPKKLSTLALSLFFVLGFSTVFVAFGASATAIGQFLLAYRYEANIVAGALIIIFGLLMIGVAKPTWLQREFRFQPNLVGGRPVTAYALGLAFAFGWTPCIGPVLGAILTVSASSAETAYGATLLSIYSLGMGLPFLAAAAFTGAFVKRLRTVRRLGRFLQVGAGAVMITMGIAMVTGYLSAFSFWLLQTFPMFGLVG